MTLPTPYCERDWLSIYHGDCLDVLRSLPDDTADLVFGSPPYEGQRTYGIDFKLTGEEWVAWMVEVVVASLRVSRGLVAFVVDSPTKNYRWTATTAKLMADLDRAGVCLRRPPIYHRSGIPGSGGADWWRNDYEPIVCATKVQGRLPWSDNTAMGQPPKWAPGGEMSYRLTNGERRNEWGGNGRTVERRRNGERGPRKPHTKRRASGLMEEQSCQPPKLANPGNVIRCKVGGGQMGSPIAHENEAPFPESLAEPFILSFCPPGGVVLDPFSGSGTTAAVAVRTNRRAIAIDVRESECEKTWRRIEEVLTIRRNTTRALPFE